MQIFIDIQNKEVCNYSMINELMNVWHILFSMTPRRVLTPPTFVLTWLKPMKEVKNKKDYNFHEEILRNKTLLAVIALSAVQSSTWTLIHNAKNKKVFKFSQRNFMKQNLKTLLAMIALSAVQSSTRMLIHKAILFVDTRTKLDISELIY